MTGRHQASLARYQVTVPARPTEKSVWGGAPNRARGGAGRVDGVATVVSGAVARPVEVVLGAAEGPEDPAQDGNVVQLAVGTDQAY